MKYSEMVKFLNDNGIYVIQPMIASALSAQLEHDITEEEFEDVCTNVENAYLEICCDIEPSIHLLVSEELVKRGYKEY